MMLKTQKKQKQETEPDEPYDLGRPSLGSEHGEDAGATAHVQDYLVLEQVLVVPYRVTVSQRPNLHNKTC